MRMCIPFAGVFAEKAQPALHQDNLHLARSDLPVWDDRPHRVAVASDGALLDGAGVLLPAYGYVWLTV